MAEIQEKEWNLRYNKEDRSVGEAEAERSYKKQADSRFILDDGLMSGIRD